jgi:hypothetical protein
VNSGDYRRNVGGYYGSGDNYRRYVGGYSGGGNDCGCSVGGYDGGGDGNYGRDVRGYDGGGGCYGDGGYSSSRIVESTFAIAHVNSGDDDWNCNYCCNVLLLYNINI